MLSDQLLETAAEFNAVIPEVQDFTMEAGLQQPDRGHVPITLEDLHDALVARESVPADQQVTEPGDPYQLTLTNYYTAGIFSDDPFEATLHVSVDSLFSCRIREDERGYDFVLVSRADQIQHEGRISDGEIKLYDRFALSERGVSDQGFVEVRDLLQRNFVSSDERVLALFDYVSTQNLQGAAMYSYVHPDGRRLRPLASFITGVTLEPGEFDWNDHRLPATLEEFHRVVSGMEFRRSWWEELLRNIDS
jgi:hypothetical protein